MESWKRHLGVATLAAVLVAPPLAAQDITIAIEKPQLREGWHTVRPGETLESIATFYLGTSRRWREIHALNREILDADRISPGQRIRVLIEDKLPSDGALVYKTSRRVEDEPVPLAWKDAEIYDVLRPRDSLRTHAAASAELLFFDDTHLLVTEDSLLIVGQGRRRQPGVDRAQIEIVTGQADLAGRIAPDRPSEIEIVVGGAVAKPRPNAAGVLETRARRPEDGGAQLMVYSGESAVTSGGAEVTVPQGMGSAVPEGAPPAPPEKLLAPPGGVEPADGARLQTPRPRFRWDPVPDARSYTLEICNDPACGLLVERVTGLTEAAYQPERLPVADLYWRVTAVSPSGLDGYPSPPAAIAVLTDTEDLEPPTIAIRVRGPHVEPRFGINEPWVLGPGSSFEIEAEDAASGVRAWEAFVDGLEASAGGLESPWSTGDEHALRVVATDGAGNVAESETLAFVYDPVPPVFRWGLEGPGEKGGLETVALAGAAPALRGLRYLETRGREWRLDSDHTQVVLRPARGKARVGEAGKIDDEEGLWILAEDEICVMLDEISYEIVADPGARAPLLRVEASDCVGNRSRVEWPMSRR